MKRILTILILASALTSCKMVDKVVKRNKTNEKTTTETTSSTTTTANTTASTAVTSTVVEETNTVVTIPEKTTSLSADIKSLLAGDTMLSETSDAKAKIYIDTITGKVKLDIIIKKQEVPVYTKKTTIQSANTFSTTNSNTKSESSLKEKKKTKTDTTEKTIHKEPLITKSMWFWYLGWVTLLVLLLLYLRKRLN